MDFDLACCTFVVDHSCRCSRCHDLFFFMTNLPGTLGSGDDNGQLPTCIELLLGEGRTAKSSIGD